MTQLEDQRRIARAADIERFVCWLAGSDEAHTVWSLLAQRFEWWGGWWDRDDLDPRHFLSDEEWGAVRWLMDKGWDQVSEAVHDLFASACVEVGREDVVQSGS